MFLNFNKKHKKRFYIYGAQCSTPVAVTSLTNKKAELS